MARTARQGNLEAIESTLDSGARPLEVWADQFATGGDLPDDIVEFAEHPEWLGRPRLYPKQRTLLRLMFLQTEQMSAYDLETIEEWSEGYAKGPDRIGVQPDVWERVQYLKDEGYPHFREILFVGGRRGGKGHIGAIAIGHQMMKLVKMGFPQTHFGIDPDKELVALITATNFLQARDNLFSDLFFVVTKGHCFQKHIASARSHSLSLRTRGDIARIMGLEKAGVSSYREIASIQAKAITSNAQAGRGVASFAQAYDEIAHMLVGTQGPRTGEEVYHALTPALDQVGKEAFIYHPTSPYTKVGIAYEIYEDSLERTEDGRPANPEMLMIQLPSWAPYEDYDDPLATDGRPFHSAPQTWGPQMERLERRNPQKFRVERRSQWAEVMDAYLPVAFVDRLFEPFSEPVSGQQRVLAPVDRGVLQWVYRMHVDPSKSQHNFALAVGHAEPVADPSDPDGEIWHHVFVDFMRVWRPQDFEDGVIPYDDIQSEIAVLAMRFPTLRTISYDQYGSFATVSHMKSTLGHAGHRARVVEKTWTEKSKQQRWERFKTALGMGWVHAYRDSFYLDDTSSLLEQELRFLQLRGGKVQKQDIGPVTTDDLADAVSTVASELLADQLDRLHRRENLAEARIALGAQGGYATRMEPAPAGARSALSRNSRRAITESYRRHRV